jgi:hypothetical protein
MHDKVHYHAFIKNVTLAPNTGWDRLWGARDWARAELHASLRDRDSSLGLRRRFGQHALTPLPYPVVGSAMRDPALFRFTGINGLTAGGRSVVPRSRN